MKPSTTLLYASSIVLAPALHAFATLNIKLPSDWAPNAKMTMINDNGSRADMTTTNDENNPALCYSKVERCEDNLPQYKFLCAPIHIDSSSTKRFVISLPGYQLYVSKALRC